MTGVSPENGHMRLSLSYARLGQRKSGGIERLSKSRVSGKLQVKFLVSNASMNRAFSSGKYGWAAIGKDRGPVPG